MTSTEKKVFYIKTEWDGTDIHHDPVKIELLGCSKDSASVAIEAPFFNDPPAPTGPPGEPFPQLWDYEVVEAFFLNDHEQYLEIEICPHGQHLVLLLNERRKAFKVELPLKVETKISGDRWTASFTIPAAYFPPNVTKFNAYAIHGSADDRRYEALYPVPKGQYEFADL